MASGQRMLRIVHFNDVYNVSPRHTEPVGGAARFTARVKLLRDADPLVLFSGDCFNPSLMSSITRGSQMVPILNGLGVHCAVVGNHDLDFGLERMEDLVGRCRFPWLMANVLDLEDRETLGGAVSSVMLQHGGLRVGVLGLVEREWLATLATLTIDQVLYKDFVEEGRRLSAELRAGGADVVIALTHMRSVNDRRLAAAVPGIDLVLGGHDHDYEVCVCPITGTTIIKSGTDFRTFSDISLEVPAAAGPGLTPPRPSVASTTRVDITSELPEDPEAAGVVASFTALMGAQMDVPIGHSMVDLDARFRSIRSGETNIGNFVTDVWREATGADVALLNSGTLRSDMVHPRGVLTVRDLMAWMPMMDATCVLRVTGAALLAALENGVRRWPSLEGRFPQVSGMRFQFNPEEAPGSRVPLESVEVGGAPLELERTYSLATKEYLFEGKDGYECLKDAEVLVEAEDAPLLPTIIRNHFDHLATFNQHVEEGRMSVDELELTDDTLAIPTPNAKRSHKPRRSTSSIEAKASRHLIEVAVPLGAEELEELEICGEADVPATASTGALLVKSSIIARDRVHGRYVIAPVVEGRITRLEYGETSVPL